MKLNEFINKVKKRDLKTVYLLFGEEEYMLNNTIDLLKKTFVDESLESLNYLQIEGSEIGFNTIFDACETLPFMSEKKIVIINDLPQLMKKKKGNSASIQQDVDIDKLSKYILNLDDYICLVFAVKGSEVHKTNALYKSIKKVGDIVEFNKIRGNDLNRWVENTFKKYNKRINRSNINYFIQRSSYFEKNQNKNLYDLENEIVKISNYMLNNRDVSKEIIDLLMPKSLEMNIFNLLNSISNKKGESAIRLFNEMYMSNEPVLFILHMIVRQLRNMLNYKVLKDKGYSDGDILSKMKLSKYEYSKVLGQSNNFTISQLEKAMFQCLETEKLIKTSSLDDRLALEVLITKLCYNIHE